MLNLRERSIIIMDEGLTCPPNNHDTLKQCWFNVSPPSATLAQHHVNVSCLLTLLGWLLKPAPWSPHWYDSTALYAFSSTITFEMTPVWIQVWKYHIMTLRGPGVSVWYYLDLVPFTAEAQHWQITIAKWYIDKLIVLFILSGLFQLIGIVLNVDRMLTFRIFKHI